MKNRLNLNRLHIEIGAGVQAIAAVLFLLALLFLHIDAGAIKVVLGSASVLAMIGSLVSLWWAAVRRQAINQAEQNSLREQQDRVNSAMVATGLGLWEWNPKTGSLIVSDIWASMLGYRADELPKNVSTWFDRVLPEDMPLVKQAIDAATQDESPYRCEYRMLHRDGSIRWIMARGSIMARNPQGDVTRFVGTHLDTTFRNEVELALSKAKESAETALRENEALYRTLNEQTILSVTDAHGQIISVNEAFCTLSGYTREQLIGQDHRILNSGQHPKEFWTQVWKTITQSQPWRGEVCYKAKDGTLFWVDSIIAPFQGADGKIEKYVSIRNDITAKKAMEEQLRDAAFKDKLTGLCNRAMLGDRLQQVVHRAKHLADYHFAVLFLDFDRFKVVNDSLGHEVGDMLLRQIALRLRAAIRTGPPRSGKSGETVAARLGGDEFVVLLDRLARPEEAVVVANRLLEVFAQPYQLAGHRVHSTASIGVFTSNIHCDSAEEVLRDADTAMYEAKLAGKARYAMFDASMRQRVLNRMNLENDLRDALKLGQIYLVYQPIVCLQTGKLESFEALARWKHPERGLVSPAEFIPIAEDTGLILAIGEWVLREACMQFAAWRQTMGADAPRSISVNLSRNQLMLADLPETIKRILKEAQMEPECLHLEVTEGTVMKDAAKAVQLLHAIKAIGVHLDMDDFGTGYSSLACLHQFPIDVLKIDRSFVANVDRGRDFVALVHSVAQLAHNLNIAVVAEGIETVEQTLTLQTMECEFGQGYFFSKPLSAEDAAKFRVSAAVLPGQAA